MARGINKVILIGNVGGDPETRYLPNGNAVTNLTLATSDSWRDKQSGEQKERTEWHRVSFFGKIAEIVGQYVNKGSKLYIEGRLQTREWEKDGVKRYTTEIVVDMGGTMQMLDGRDDSGGQNTNRAPQNNQQGQQRQQQKPQQQRQQNQGQQYQGQQQSAQQSQPEDDQFDSDIPF